MVAKAWREFGVAPWQEGTFKLSTDPELVARVVDVVRLYLAPPENAIGLCIDERTQVQSLAQAATVERRDVPGLAATGQVSWTTLMRILGTTVRVDGDIHH
ncbi:hypothetical protein H488_0117005 [Kocuria sp. UCD-OTCP]|nr:hypothetical protein H488_0117005 [Kocuria sp. UCD-OTCP]